MMMMKQVCLIWSLLITLVIFLGAMPTASAIKCYQCSGCYKSSDKLKLEECPNKEDNGCKRETVADYIVASCFKKGKDEKLKCGAEKNYQGHNTTVCLCDTNGCNGSDDGKGTEEDENGSGQLGQMSLWPFFTLSIMGPLTRKVFFAD